MAVFLQLANTAVALSYWSSQLPCWLQSIQLQLNSSPELFYQQQASELCQALQYMASGLRMAFGDVTYALHDGHVCEGLRAVQVLQAFATIVGLLVLPLSVKYGLERRFKRQFLQSLQQAELAQAAAEAAASGSSSSSALAALEGVANGAAGVAAGSHGSSSSGSSAAAVVTGEEPQSAVVLRWVACILGLVVAAWLLAELLVSDVYSRISCGEES
jgi:hypothetical protein